MEEDIKIIKNHYVFTTNHVLDDENKRFKQAIENLINKYKELLKERDGIYADYQDLGKEKLKLEEENQVVRGANNYWVMKFCEVNNKNKEQEKMIELMAKELAVCGGFDYVEFGMSTGDFNKDIKNMIDYFKKKAKGE